MLIEPNCHKRRCVHFRGAESDGDEITDRVFCAAFPEEIPNEIAYGDNLHLTPFPEDRGIRFERQND